MASGRETERESGAHALRTEGRPCHGPANGADANGGGKHALCRDIIFGSAETSISLPFSASVTLNASVRLTTLPLTMAMNSANDLALLSPRRRSMPRASFETVRSSDARPTTGHPINEGELDRSDRRQRPG